MESAQAIDAVTYHARRAMAELDLAARAASPQAAHAHHALATLHLERMQLLAGPAGAPAAVQETALFQSRPAA